MAPVEQFAGPIFISSDNVAAGKVIDLIGPNQENIFYWSIGMNSSAFTQWGSGRVATNSPRAMGDDNYFTSNDAVTFLRRVATNTIPHADVLQNWMNWAPKTGYGGWIGTLLPESARKTLKHKAGWLPPGSTSDDSKYKYLNDIGIITTDKGVRYAIAVFTRRGKVSNT